MSRHRAVRARAGRSGDTLTMLVIAGAGILTQFLNLVTGVLAARMLGVEGRGQLVLVAALAQMASQLTLGGGLPTAITKELASQGMRARDGLRGLRWRWLVWGVLGAVPAGFYFLLTVDSEVDSFVIALAVATAVMALLNMGQRILVGSMLGEHAKPLNIAMTGVLSQGLAVLVLVVGTVAGASWNAFEIVLVILVCQTLVVANRYRSLAPSLNPDRPPLDRRALAQIARHNYVGSIGPLDGLGLDRVLVGSIIGSVAVGLYSTAVALGSLAAILGTAIAMVALPKIAAAQHLARDVERAVVRRWILASIAVIVPAVAVFELANPVAIPLLFGEEFEDAVPCGYWYIAASGFLAFRRVLIATLQGRGRGSVASWIELSLTPFVVLAVYLATLTDDVETIGMGMLGVGVTACLALGIAVARAEPAPVGDLDDEAVPADPVA